MLKDDFLPVSSNKAIAEPPLNLLFNVSSISKQNIWKINLVHLLELLVNIIDSSGKRDLRVCGIAALSSSLIYRLKVESIFDLEKIAMQKKSISADPKETIPQLNIVDFPFRYESTYPVSIEDLFEVLENMLSELANPKPRKIQLGISPLESFDFDQYLIKFDQVIEHYEESVMEILNEKYEILFSYFKSKYSGIELARFFIAILFLASKDKLIVDNIEEDFKIKIKIDKLDLK